MDLESKLSRRDFLNLTGRVAAGSLIASLFPFSSFAQSSENKYLEAKINPKIRQEYLNQFLDSTRDSFPYVDKVIYEQNPKMFAIMKLLETELSKKEKGISIIPIDGEKLRRAYAYVIRDPSKFGKKQKSEVYVFPKAFDELKEDEFRIIMYHENVHCRDIFEGIKLGKENFDISRLNPYVLNELLELRAGYEELEYIFSVGMKQGESFLQKVRLSFIQEREGEYVSSYMALRNLLEQEQLSPYESNAVRKHLLHFDKWIKPASRYKE